MRNKNLKGNKMTRNERTYLEDLSLKVYGSKTKWKKMVDHGEVADLSETLEDGTVRKYRGISRYSLEEVQKIMEELDKEEQELAKKEQELKAKEQNEQSNIESVGTSNDREGSGSESGDSQSP